MLIGLEGVDVALAFMSFFTGDLTALISFGLAITVLAIVHDDGIRWNGNGPSSIDP